MNIIITCPDILREGTEQLCDFYRNEQGIMYFRVPNLPKQCLVGDKCYIVSNNCIIGYHLICGMRHVSQEEAQKLSHGNWNEGHYILRNANTWVELKDKAVMKGFQGFHYYK